MAPRKISKFRKIGKNNFLIENGMCTFDKTTLNYVSEQDFDQNNFL